MRTNPIFILSPESAIQSQPKVISLGEHDPSFPSHIQRDLLVGSSQH